MTHAQAFDMAPASSLNFESGSQQERNEPPEAFRYKAPDEQLRRKYAVVFALREPLKNRPLKLLFDKLLSFCLLVLTSPIFLIAFVAYFLEGIFIPESRGPFFIHYTAVSRGRKFPKYKFRLIKQKFVDKEAEKRGEWHAYAGEWSPGCATFVGHVLKKFYLDELPQLYNILRGDMSFVGPRPLAVHHYERDLAQGNVVRSVLKAGLVGAGQVLKGTAEMGNPDPEYRYVEQYMKLSAPRLLWVDFVIMALSIKVVLQGKGL
jgi:lipopolysaccharide/colanic/teichoic acid biosynthesis glycosyltransferase